MNRTLHSCPFAAKLVLWLAFLCLCTGLLAVPEAVNAEDNSVSYQYDPQNWMKVIPGHTDLAEINIPGTHDSGTAYVNTLPESSMCQVYSIADQLKYGIRVFDLRVRYDEIDYGIYKAYNVITGKEVWPFETMVLSHGGCDCYEPSRLKKLTTKSVFSTCKKFVQAHPSEGIILQIKTESAFYDIKEYKEDIKKGLNNIWKYIGNDPVFIPKSAVATLNQLRGKILILIDEPEENVTSYHFGNMNPPDADDAREKKVNYVYAALDSSAWQVTSARTNHANLWREAKYEQEDEKPREKEGKPQFQMICTNATDVKDFSSTVLPKYGPYGYAVVMRPALKNYDWIVGKRYGIVRMDFPSRSVIQQVVESNNNYVRYQADFIWNDTQDHQRDETPEVELVDNGKVLHILAEPGRTPLENGENGFRITYETVLQRTENGGWNGSASFRAADGCEYALTLGPVVETREWFTDKDKQPYLGFVRTQTIYVGELEKKAYDLPVYYLSEIDDKPYRPEMTPSGFLGIMDYLSIAWETSEGIKHTQAISNLSYSKIFSLDSISEVSDNEWMLHFTVPKYDRKGVEVAYHFDKLELRKWMTPFVQCDCGHSDGIGLKLPQNQMIEIYVQYQAVADRGQDQFKEITKIKNALASGGIHHIADLDDGTVVIDEMITDPSRLRFGANGILYISVQEYDEQYHRLNHRFEPPQIEEFDLTVEVGPQSRDLWSYRLMTDLTVSVGWDDDSDYAQIRPTMLDITFYGRNQKGVVLSEQPVEVYLNEDTDTTPEDRNRWRIKTKMPVLYLTDDEIKNNILNPEEKLTKITVPGYTVKSITKKVTQGQDGKPVYDFDIVLSVIAKDASIDVSGVFIFDDADLRIADHSSYLDGLTMPVLQNRVEMEDPALRLELNKENGTYAYRPKEKFPAYRYGEYQRYPYEYLVIAPPSLEDYELVNTIGFDFYYRRLVSISGTVDWMEGMKPEGDVEITVKLFCNGEDTDRSLKVGKDQQYVFDWLPISGKTGAVNQYSIQVETSYYGATALYSTVERDPDNGCFTQNALLSAKWNVPEVDIPIELELKNADPQTEPEEFAFELVCTSDSDIAARTVRLNRENGFAGAFHIDDLQAYNHKYTFEVKQQISVPKDYWHYDTDAQGGDVEITLTAGYAPQVKMNLPGGKDKLTFVNLYTGTGSVASIKLTKKIENRLAGIKEVPKKTFTFSLYDVTDGEPKLVSSTSVTGEGATQFSRLRFDRAGTYRYRVSENIPDGKLAEWTYDKTTIPVEITVEESGGIMQAYVSTVPEFTNVYENECFDINVRVEWNGVNKKWPIPQSVNVQLLADGSQTGDADAEKKTGWICKFPNMPGYAFPMRLLKAAKGPGSTATLIEYTLTADEVPGYRQSITGSAKTGYVVTYSLKYPPDTGDETRLALWLALACAALLAAGFVLRRRRG